MKSNSPANPEPVAIVSQPADTRGLPLRRDEVVPGSFVLETLLALVVLLGALTLALRWLKKRQPGRWNQPQDRHMQVIETLRTSPRTRISLIMIGGKRAVVTETTQGASLQFVPEDSAEKAAAVLSTASMRQGHEE